MGAATRHLCPDDERRTAGLFLFALPGIVHEVLKSAEIGDQDGFPLDRDAMRPELGKGAGKAFGLHSEPIGQQALLEWQFDFGRPALASLREPDDEFRDALRRGRTLICSICSMRDFN